MAEFVYILCALTGIVCAHLLYRRYRRRPSPLLLWSAFGFGGLSLSNIVLCIDLIILPTVDLAEARGIIALASLACILIGLVWHMGASRQ